MRYLTLLVLPFALAVTQNMDWPMGSHFTREMILQIPRPELPSPPCQVFIDKAPWGTPWPSVGKSQGDEHDDQDDLETEGPGIVTHD